MYLIKFIAYNKFINFYHSVYQYSLFMCYYIQIYMYVIHWLCIDTLNHWLIPWQEFGYINSLIYTLAAHHTLFTVCTSFSVKFLIQGLILIFFYLFILYVAHAMWRYSWMRVILYKLYCLSREYHVTYCGLALESMRITVNKVLNCILNSQGKFVYPFDLTMNIERYQ